MMKAQAQAKQITLKAKVVRADGRVEDLGTIAELKEKSVLKKVKDFFLNK